MKEQMKKVLELPIIGDYITLKEGKEVMSFKIEDFIFELKSPETIPAEEALQIVDKTGDIYSILRPSTSKIFKESVDNLEDYFIL